MIKYFRKFAIAAFAITFAIPPNASSSTATNGYISNLSISSSGTAWFNFTGQLSGSLPSCADPNGLWMIDSTQPGYQGLLASLLSAKAQQIKISIQGTGECGASDHERIAYIVIP